METMGWREAWAVAQAMVGPWLAWGLLASVALLVLLLAWSVLSGRRLRWRWVGRFAALLGAVWTVAGLAWATGVPLTRLVAGGGRTCSSWARLRWLEGLRPASSPRFSSPAADFDGCAQAMGCGEGSAVARGAPGVGRARL
jgi:hypothetical protein